MLANLKSIFFCLFVISASAMSAGDYINDFSDSGINLSKVGRGECQIAGGVLRTKGAYALLGDGSWKDYTLSFRARVPEDADQVQIWSGFRTANRFDRYVLGIKGGLQDDVYLFRSGYMGTDEFMGVRPLGFHPVPGEWLDVKVQVCGQRIRVFINGSDKPYIDIVDKNGEGMAPAGAIALGGGWITAEYDDVRVTPLDSDALDGVGREEMNFGLTPEQKEAKRKDERASYKPKSLASVGEGRTEMSLDGDWLFMPTYQLDDSAVASSAKADDSEWHVMNVPDFWSPIRIWLHGETMPSPAGDQPKGVSDTYYQRETDRCESYTFDYRRTKGAWYRQWVDLPKNIKGRKLILKFDAVSKMADVYVNGHKTATHLGMFGNFDVDVTPYVKSGRNLIAIRVARDINGVGMESDKAMENYYSSVRRDVNENKDDLQANKELITDIPHGFFGDNPAGIWQPVKLVITEPLHIDDVFIRPSMTGAEFDVEVANNSSGRRTFNLFVDIKDKSTGNVLYSGQLLSGLKLEKAQSSVFNAKVDGLKPKLWEPSTPNLYDFSFRIEDESNKVSDSLTVTSGFRTFESKDGFFYLNGRKFWLRGGNHIPFTLGMNDSRLADRFMQLMKEGNVNSTRTHTTPWNELWLDAADRNGIAVSFEGTWSWLMIHSTPIPSDATLELWKKEWLQVMKRFRNHPSLIFWTVNNEMKFYDLDADDERAKAKFRIISDAVKEMRVVDPSRPVSFDSNYMRRNGVNRFGEDFMATVDDGDIDDNHGYYNWYDFSVFRFFNGEFQRQFKTPGRPLISQEMSTGYPNAETGHPTRSYQLIHQNPFSLVGYEAYDFADPANFLKVQAFITGELAETLRRTNPEAAGIMHFAYMTWFRQCYDRERIAPWPAYFAMKRAMQPVLVSAELWGRNFYAGDSIATRVYVVNDDEQGRNLPSTCLRWSLLSDGNDLLAQGYADFPSVEYYGRKYIEPQIEIPEGKIESKTYAKLQFELIDGDSVLSVNRYDVCIAPKSWNTSKSVAYKGRIGLMSGDSIGEVMDFLGIAYSEFNSVDKMLKSLGDADACVISSWREFTTEDVAKLREFSKSGGHLILLNSEELACAVYPEYIVGHFIPTEGDIVVMERDDDSIFDGLDVLDLRYFNNGRREIPLACNAVYKVVRHDNVRELASQMKIHAYIDGGKPEDRIAKIESMRGLTLFEITDNEGKGLVSTICVDKGASDPIAGRVLVNIIGRSE